MTDNIGVNWTLDGANLDRQAIEAVDAWTKATRQSRRPHLLRTAERLVTQDRNTTYDDPSVDFRRIAGLWQVYLGIEIEPYDVGALMALLKIARIAGDPTHADSWVDLAGYAACGYDVSDAELEEGA